MSLYNITFLYILLLSSDLPTVKHFLQKQTQLKSVKFGNLEDTKVDAIDTVKVLKCYCVIATGCCQCLPCAVWVESVVDAGVRAVEVCQLCV